MQLLELVSTWEGCHIKLAPRDVCPLGWRTCCCAMQQVQGGALSRVSFLLSVYLEEHCLWTERLLTIALPGAGGRMVKWLEEITVAPEESQNFYHFHDNRVLPPGVDQEKAKAEGARPQPYMGETSPVLAISPPIHPHATACPDPWQQNPSAGSAKAAALVIGVEAGYH